MKIGYKLTTRKKFKSFFCPLWLTKEISSFVRENQKLPLVVGAGFFCSHLGIYFIEHFCFFYKATEKRKPSYSFPPNEFLFIFCHFKGNIIFLGNERKYFCSIKFYIGEVFILFIPIKICTSISFLYRGYIHPYIFIQPVNRLWGYANRKRMCFLVEHFLYVYTRKFQCFVKKEI